MEFYKSYEKEIDSVLFLMVLLGAYYNIFSYYLYNLAGIIFLTILSLNTLNNDSFSKSKNIYIKLVEKWTFFSIYLMVDYLGEIFLGYIYMLTLFRVFKTLLLFWIIVSDGNFYFTFDYILTYYNNYSIYFNQLLDYTELVLNMFTIKWNQYFDNYNVKLKKKE